MEDLVTEADLDVEACSVKVDVMTLFVTKEWHQAPPQPPGLSELVSRDTFARRLQEHM